jgi:K+-transporting ATPase ATPase A chain
MAILAILIPNAGVLLGAGLATILDEALASRANLGPHGLSEILYAFASAGNNNGSAFGGLNANVDFYNIALGIVMITARFGVIIPVMVIAGSMVGKRVSPPSPGTFPTDGGLFVGLLIAVVLIVGALTFLPALSLGPIVEHYLMEAGQTF